MQLNLKEPGGLTVYVMKMSATAVVLSILFPCTCLAREAVVPAGSLPVMQDVDVVVVGGSSGGVAAAVAAAKKGAKVFLVAPRPYLGEDLCASYRLWLEPGEKPTTELAHEIYQAASVVTAVGKGLPFEYRADQPSSTRHKDTNPGTLLKDGKWQSAAMQSVQYDGNASLLVDLGQTQKIQKVHLMVYQRQGDFEMEQVAISTSPDQKEWSELAMIKNEQAGQAFEQSAMPFSASVAIQTRYLKFAVKKSAEANRVLLGEIVIEGDAVSEKAPAGSERPQFVTPMQVKRTLDQALIRAGVPFLYGSFITEVLRDGQGRASGVVIANRSGRQAVIAKLIVDATERATVARLAGAKFATYPPETQYFSRLVIGGEPRTGDMISLQKREPALSIMDRKGDLFPVFEYRVQMAMRDGSFAAFAEAEQLARDWTWTKGAVDGSENLFQIPPDSMASIERQDGGWRGADEISLKSLQPAGQDRIFVIGGCADVGRDAAAELVRPVNLMAVGERLGNFVGGIALGQDKPLKVKLAKSAVAQAEKGQVLTVSPDVSPRSANSIIPAKTHGLPVLGEYDVVVVGGGTGGAPAGIAAGRHGAKTLLIEYLHGLGGVGTLGLISQYYHGNRVGFTHEVDLGVSSMGGVDGRTSGGWNPETKIEWYRRELRQAGVEIWYGAMGIGALVEDGRLKGVVVATEHGPGVVLAKVVIDATGNADIAAAAGATCRYIDETDVAMQGTGLPPRELGSRYTNTDFTFVDDTDVTDIWRVLVMARQKYKGAYDVGQLIDTRERRQIVGDFTLSPMDMMLGRTHADTIVIAQSNFDTHGFIVHPMFMVRSPDRKDVSVRVPYRCLLPKGLDGILVTGLGVSAHRDALPVIRMQPDVQNQGYAAGLAASMIAKKGCATRELDTKALQQHLVEKGNLPESVLTETDSFPLPREKVAQAISRVTNNYDGLEIILAQFGLAQPLLREALAGGEGANAKLTYAHILGMMGDDAGVQVLANEVRKAGWDKGWRYTGMGQFGPCMSPLDSLIIALGRTRDKRALGPILEKASQLNSDSEFSHFRAVSMALETLGDASARKPLAELLQKPGLSGHAVTKIQAALKKNPSNANDNSTRNEALSELVLARALYRCGDYEGRGEAILRQYAGDLHGIYARHAQGVLRKKSNLPGVSSKAL